MMNKTALIIGISGQDGTYLAKFLLNKHYNVWGTSRDAEGKKFENHRKLKIENQVHLLSMIPEDFRSILVALKTVYPDEIYFLAGQSSVGLSFEQPAETFQSIVLGTLNLLEASKMLDKAPKIYLAGSSECFGDTKGSAANETTPFAPESPYAVAKASSFWLANNYRKAYKIFSCTGILFNHESCLRPARFVTQKIIKTAKRISEGSKETLELGRLDISRDWGWAPEYVNAMWLMLQQEEPSDYVIATGQTNSLESFVSEVFKQLNLDWKDHVRQNKKFIRPTDILVSVGDAQKAKMELDWVPSKKMKDIVKLMLENSLDL